MYKLTETGILRLADNANIPNAEGNRDWQEYQEWIAAGNTPTPLPAPTFEEKTAEYVAAVQAHMDTEAQKYGYDNIHTAASYAEETAIVKFQDEGKGFRTWRSECWGYCYKTLDSVKAGTMAMPTIADLIASLPVLNITYTPEAV